MDKAFGYVDVNVTSCGMASGLKDFTQSSDATTQGGAESLRDPRRHKHLHKILYIKGKCKCGPSLNLEFVKEVLVKLYLPDLNPVNFS